VPDENLNEATGSKKSGKGTGISLRAM